MSATVLQTSVIIDYQNVHLTAAGLFGQDGEGRHLYLIHPLSFAVRALYARNRLMRPGFPVANLARVLVYRGLPNVEHDPLQYKANLAQQAEWERDPRVTVVHRPLKYVYEKDANGRPASDVNGKRIVKSKTEKGIDVLCALALIREARKPDVEAVILASQDTDLEPALDEALEWTEAKVETVSWFKKNHGHASHEIRPRRGRRIWNTRLDEIDFEASRDRKIYDVT